MRDRLVRAAWDGARCRAASGIATRTSSATAAAGARHLPQPRLRPAHDAGRAAFAAAMFLNAACGGEDEDRLDGAVVAAHRPPGRRVAARRQGDAARLRLHPRRGRPAARGPHDLRRARCVRARASRARAPTGSSGSPRSIPIAAMRCAALESAKAAGARAVKWLPQAMGIDLAHRAVRGHSTTRCAGSACRSSCTSGEEQAVEGAGRHDLGNPLALRHPLRRRRPGRRGALRVAGRKPRPRRRRRPGACARGRGTSTSSRGSCARRAYCGAPARRPLGRDPGQPRLRRPRDHRGIRVARPPPQRNRLPAAGDHAALLREGLRARRECSTSPRVPVLSELRHVNPLAFDFVLKRSLSLARRGLARGGLRDPRLLRPRVPRRPDDVLPGPVLPPRRTPLRAALLDAVPGCRQRQPVQVRLHAARDLPRRRSGEAWTPRPRAS